MYVSVVVSDEIAGEHDSRIPTKSCLLFCPSRRGNEHIFNVLWNPMDCSDTKHCEIGHKMSARELVP